MSELVLDWPIPQEYLDSRVKELDTIESANDVIDELALRSLGFHKFYDDAVYSLRIHDRTFLEFDLRDHFCTLVRFEEFVKHGEDRVKITLPKKMETRGQLEDLIEQLV